MHDSRSLSRKRRLLLLQRTLDSLTHVGTDPVETDGDPVDRFFDACGVAQGLRFEVASESGRPLAEGVAERPCLIIGRSADCDVQLTHPDVSRHHAYLQQVGHRIFCFDLASRTGTRVNGETVRSGQLRAGDELTIGPYAVRIAASDFDEPAEDEVTEMPPVSVSFLNASRARPPRPLRESVTLVGQSRRCAIRLEHESVSPVHCSIVSTVRGSWVIDLPGGGGTLVNGEPVEIAPLRETDELQIGRFRLRVHPGESPASPRPRATVPITASNHAGDPSAVLLELLGEYAELQQAAHEQSLRALIELARVAVSTEAPTAECRRQLAALRRRIGEMQQWKPQARLTADPGAELNEHTA